MISAVLLGVMVIAAASIAISYNWFVNKEIPQGNSYFTIEPGPWIEDVGDGYRINVKKATRDLGLHDGKKQDLIYEGEIISVFTAGYYKGQHFERAYLDPSYNSTGNISGSVRMHISPDMVPGDGIMSAFALVKEEGEKLVAYIFVDEDWRQQMAYTNIVYAADFTEGVKQEQFEYNVEKDGVYVDRIVDVSWLKDSRTGGILVGDIDSSIVQLQNASMLESTFIYIQ